jgi:aminoglycoside phosphotransferase (APT) family kinase protein
LLDVYDDRDWVALAFEAIEGRLPNHPWERMELDAVVAALEGAHDALTPSPAAHLEPAQRHYENLFGGWAELATARDTPGLDPWCRANLAHLAELEAGWPGAIEGRTLVNGDIRSDNILIGAAGPVFVDWTHAAVGNPVFDLVAWAPSIVLEGGPQPEELLALHGPSRSADPEVVSALLAAVSGFFVSHSLRPAPPGLPTLRGFQAAQGEVSLTWLRRHIQCEERALRR